MTDKDYFLEKMAVAGGALVMRYPDADGDYSLQGDRFALLGSMGQMALTNVLLESRSPDWERLYFGYVQWSKDAENCPYKGREEENARTSMLYALAKRIQQLEKVAGKKAA